MRDLAARDKLRPRLLPWSITVAFENMLLEADPL
jgi:hypothetical protein